MSYYSSIEWTDATWNPVVGCTKVSEGCRNCYAETLAERFRGVPSHPFERGFEMHLAPERLAQPLEWKNPRKVFVCSMSDLFHEGVPLEYIQNVFAIMEEASWHNFQVLTKRASRLADLCAELPWPPNVWLGVSVESAEYVFRIRHLARVPATVRFLSVEPLIGPIPDLPLGDIDWVIVGGESGPRARPMDLDWARGIRDQCHKASVAFFLKQLGGRRDKRGGEKAILDGQKWHQIPDAPSTAPAA
jgi:protein gp37